MRKTPRKIPTPQNLATVALHYLGRYSASEASLRHVLQNRLRRAAMENAEFNADKERMRILRSAIETIIETHKKTGALDDAAFAEVKIVSLRRQGRSRRAIQQKMAAKGVGRDIVAAALAQNDDGLAPDEVELKAAMALARRRRLGPFRKTPGDLDRRRKDFAALARAGFSFSIIQAVLRNEVPADAQEDFPL